MFKNTNNNILRNIITTYLYGQTDNFCWILVVVSRHSAPLRPLLAEYCFLSKQLTGCTPSDLSRWPICFSVRLHTHTHQKNPGKTLSLSLSFYPSPLRPVRTALAAAKRSVPVYTFFVPPPFLFSPRFSFFKHRGQGFSFFLKKRKRKKGKKKEIYVPSDGRRMLRIPTPLKNMTKDRRDPIEKTVNIHTKLGSASCSV